MIIAPQTEEQRAASEKLRRLVADAQAQFEKLSPVDQAIRRLEQRRSAVLGLTPMDSPLSREDVNAILDKQPEYVVLAAYQAAEARAARLQADVESVCQTWSLNGEVRLRAGEMTAGEMRAARACLDGMIRQLHRVFRDTAPDASGGRAG